MKAAYWIKPIFLVVCLTLLSLKLFGAKQKAERELYRKE